MNDSNLNPVKAGDKGRNPNGRPKKVATKIVDLFKSYGIKKMSKSEALDIISYIISANELQMAEILANDKIPLLFKTVVKSVKNDINKGKMDSFEKLLDRFSGKATQQIESKNEHLFSGASSINFGDTSKAE